MPGASEVPDSTAACEIGSCLARASMRDVLEICAEGARARGRFAEDVRNGCGEGEEDVRNGREEDAGKMCGTGAEKGLVTGWVGHRTRPWHTHRNRERAQMGDAWFPIVNRYVVDTPSECRIFFSSGGQRPIGKT
jgi:hypothetical protein